MRRTVEDCRASLPVRYQRVSRILAEVLIKLASVTYRECFIFLMEVVLEIVDISVSGRHDSRPAALRVRSGGPWECLKAKLFSK